MVRERQRAKFERQHKRARQDGSSSDVELARFSDDELDFMSQDEPESGDDASNSSNAYL